MSICWNCKECVQNYTACLAGNGDDEFTQITEEIAKELLESSISESSKTRLLDKYPNLK